MFSWDVLRSKDSSTPASWQKSIGDPQLDGLVIGEANDFSIFLDSSIAWAPGHRWLYLRPCLHSPHLFSPQCLSLGSMKRESESQKGLEWVDRGCPSVVKWSLFSFQVSPCFTSPSGLKEGAGYWTPQSSAASQLQ